MSHWEYKFISVMVLSQKSSPLGSRNGIPRYFFFLQYIYDLEFIFYYYYRLGIVGQKVFYIASDHFFPYSPLNLCYADGRIFTVKKEIQMQLFVFLIFYNYIIIYLCVFILYFCNFYECVMWRRGAALPILRI